MTDDLDQTTVDSQGPFQPAREPASAAYVLPPGAASRSRRSRWPIAAGVVAVVVALSALTLGLFTGRAANATVLGYVPADSIMYGEIRLDLPGDQRANVGAFLSRFPGFADPSSLDTKIDDVFDRLISSATAGAQTFSADIKPWFGGEFAFSVGALPNPGDPSAPDVRAMDGARFLILLSIKDETAARAWFDAAMVESGASSSTEAYGGETITVLTGHAGPPGAYAILAGTVAVAGDVASVKAAVDTNGASAFASNAETSAALDATTGDHVGFVFMALRPLLEWSSQAAGLEAGGTLPGESVLAMIPDWTAMALRAEGDALLIEMISPTPDSATGPIDNRTSALADHVPGSAIGLAIGHEIGPSLIRTMDAYRSDPSLGPTLELVDQAIGVLGGTESAIGWIGDVGLVVNHQDDALEGGLVILPTDRAAAGRLFTSLRTLIALGGDTVGATVRDEDHAGTTITILEFDDIDRLAGQAGLSPELLGSGGLPLGTFKLAYAVSDHVVVIGTGPDFVRHVLDTSPATSIASNERYKAPAARVGQGTGIAFLDLTAIRELIEARLADADPSELVEYEQNVKPFLTPFTALVGSNAIDGALTRSTIIVTVR